jgi:hypothetical protein
MQSHAALCSLTITGVCAGLFLGLTGVRAARADTYDFAQAANLLFTGSQFSPSRQVGFINGVPLSVTVDSADAENCIITIRVNSPDSVLHRTFFLNNVAAKDLAISEAKDGLTTSLTGTGIVSESYSEPSQGEFTKFNPDRQPTAKVETPVPLPRATIEEAWASIYPRYCKGV